MINQAVLSIVEEKDNILAIKRLTKLLRQVKGQMSIETRVRANPEMIKDERLSCRRQPSAMFFWHTAEFVYTPVVTQRKTSSLPSSSGGDSVVDGSRTIFLFKAPILLQTEEEGTSSSKNEDSQTDYELRCFVIMYNMALAYHLQGVQEQETGHDLRRRDYFLRKASELYIHAHRVLMICREDLMRYHHSRMVCVQATMIFLIEMAIASNLGHIYTALGDNDRSRSFFEDLLSMILYFVMDRVGKVGGQGTSSSDLSNILPGMMEGFYHNVLHLILDRSQSAAAA